MQTDAITPVAAVAAVAPALVLARVDGHANAVRAFAVRAGLQNLHKQ